MKSLGENLCTLVSHESGQGLVEYSLIITLVAFVVIVALSKMGGIIDSMFGDIKNEMEKHVTPAAS
ncbi:hypothetical protein KL86CLO1_10949 [uncultured Eubacteriales bacterium]|uniref:Flp pilus assembly protein, pilin Flp n=1 Tax=uncultured Eubacteriales bacterium TaxID=172733 RepID=A0A212JE50_9FIRM|nr:hypothetical protein KL86CLO1_10949 [uncultured Eubacteriales bacterium]